MAQTYSTDLRVQFVRAVAAGTSARAAGRRLRGRAEQRRSRVDARRRAWFEQQLDLEPERLVFVDEAGTSTKMARRYGRGPRAANNGARRRTARPLEDHDRHRAGLRLDGLIAPLVLTGR